MSEPLTMSEYMAWHERGMKETGQGPMITVLCPDCYGEYTDPDSPVVSIDGQEIKRCECRTLTPEEVERVGDESAAAHGIPSFVWRYRTPGGDVRIQP